MASFAEMERARIVEVIRARARKRGRDVKKLEKRGPEVDVEDLSECVGAKLELEMVACEIEGTDWAQWAVRSAKRERKRA